MDFHLQTLISQLSEVAAQTYDIVAQPAVLYQGAIIIVLFAVSLFVSSRIEPRLEALARNIRGNPGLLRIIVAFLRRLEWAFFIVLLGMALALMRALAWPGRDYIVYVALLLALAWLVIAVLSRSVRNRMMARFISIAGWSYVAITILGITSEAAAFLDSVGFSVGDVRISALLLIKTVALLGVTLWLAVSVGNFLDRRIQSNEDLTPSFRVLIGKVLKITLIVVAGFVAMSGIGIDLTLFTVFSGAIGVGIGFGLQKVVSNFISGLIILLDRSIKPGDTISLGDTFGWIRELRARFVSVVTRDGREFLIPNEDFITREVINWSYSDDFVRIDIPFGVSYDANPHEVTEISIAAGVGVERVVAHPQPVCWLTGFGDSSLDFVLRVWIRDPQKGLTNVRGQVLLALWDTFKAHGVNIPYPHREVIMKNPVKLTELETAPSK
tara:strand:+ start:6626 stop:7945 length:1320 start_codon:yes stop_codon:yes gene_type:complete